MSAAHISTNPEAHKLLTKESLKAALLKDKGPDAKFKSYEIVDFCCKGDNYASFVTSVKVTFVLGGQENNESYVAKLNHCNKMEAFELFCGLAFEKEGKFYMTLIPDLNNVLKRLSLPSLKFVSCYFISFEPSRQVILLADKRQEGFKMASRFVGLDDDHVVLAVKELARLHAVSVILADDLGDEEMKKKYDFLKDVFSADETGAMAKFDEEFLIGNVYNGARIAERIAGYEKVSSWLKEQAPTAGKTLAAISDECDPKFSVICHGDCWTNNLLFRYEDGKVADVCLLDLQVSRQASLALDLNYFFFTSLNGDTRKKGLEFYLTAYYNTFKEVFDAAKKPMKFTREELYAEYRNKNLFGLLMAIMEVPMMVMESTDIPDLKDVGSDNIQQLMKEQQQKVLDMIDMSSVLRPRLLDMFDEMVEYGTIKID